MTSVPPSRRRPVPTTPTTRPRVAGLRKRPDPASTPNPEPTANPEPTSAEGTRTGDTTTSGTGTSGNAPSGTGSTAAGPTGAGSTAGEPAATAARPGAEAAEAEGGPADLPYAYTGLIEPRETDEPADEAPEHRPRPTGRRKRTGEAVAPSVLDDDEPEREKDDADDRAARHTDRGSGMILPLSLIVLAVLLVGLGLWFQNQAGEVRYNQALVDSGGTTEVAGQAREAVEKAFSYNFADVSATEKAANELLVGKAKCQYNAIFGPVRALAPEQKLVVTVKAVSSGVTTLDGDRATVLLFLDQVTTRTTDNQSGGGIAMMRVGAQKVDGRWKVDNMEMFGQSGDQAAETAKC
ncbi:hypothetical protein ACIQMJ_07950 [Actinosynnema sp. NPDC091369]